MKTLKIISVVVIAIVITCFLATWWLGFYTKVAVIDKQEGGYILVGENYTGDYTKVSKTLMMVDLKLKSVGINCNKSFGLYYDDPKTTPIEKCRSFLGNILETRYLPREDEIKHLDLKFDSVKIKQALVIEFPYRTRLSYFIGPMKAYPALRKYASEKNYKPTLAMEIYEPKEGKILYIMQYDK